MAGSLNKVCLIGRLGRDPETRTFQNGGKVCILSVATEESWKDKASGERKSKTEWHKVSIYNEALADIADRYLKKGALVYLEGKLETRKYEKDGQDHYSTEIVLKAFNGTLTMLEGRDSGEGGEAPAAAPSQRPASSPAQSAPMDDDIPF